MEAQIRMAAFKWLEQQTAIHGDVLPRDILTKGFDFNGQRVTLMGPQGIWKPKQFNLIPLSVTHAPSGPYDDQVGDNFILYRYRGKDIYHRDNVGLREAYRNKVPLIYFHGITKGKYFAAWPAFIENDDPKSLTFTVSVDDIYTAHLFSEHQGNNPEYSQYIAEESGHYRRLYTTSTVKTRLHQRSFRERVLDAYRQQCAFCQLKHPELLDAAHIIPDAEQRGTPIISNGLSLCKIHHAAFDRHIIGVTPEYQIRVQEKILKEVDGPMLRHGIQQLHEQKIILPRNKELWPDQERLADRYAKFVRAV